MTHVRTWNVSSSVMRSIGGLAVAQSHLGRIRRDVYCFPTGQDIAGWCQFADHLAGIANAIMAAAVAATDERNTLHITDAAGRRVPMDVASIVRVTAKLDQHSRMAYLIGYEKADVAASPAPTASAPPSEPIAAYLPPLEAVE